jgi:hypothetical protein
MRKRILVLLTAIVMALTMTAAPAALAHSSDGGYHDGSYRSSSYKNGPWCHWYSGYGYKVVWGKSHYYHGDPRAKRYYDDWGDLHYSCSYLDHRGYDQGHNNGYDNGDDD